MRKYIDKIAAKLGYYHRVPVAPVEPYEVIHCDMKITKVYSSVAFERHEQIPMEYYKRKMQDQLLKYLIPFIEIEETYDAEENIRWYRGSLYIGRRSCR